jgi:hypothetical protein
MDVQPRVAGGGEDGVSIDDLIYDMAGEFLEKLPKKNKFKLSENPKPLEVFRR